MQRCGGTFISDEGGGTHNTILRENGGTKKWKVLAYEIKTWVQMTTYRYFGKKRRYVRGGFSSITDEGGGRDDTWVKW